MERKLRNVLWTFLAIVYLAPAIFAADAVIRGTVTDDSGKPLRGAVV
jgi:hypothetical protein